MNTVIPVRHAVIRAAVATAIIPMRRAIKPEDRLEAIKTMEDAERAKGFTQDGDEHHCPLCNEFFTYFDLVDHAQECINLRAPKWEGHRDRAPRYLDQKKFRPTIFGPTGRNG